MTLLPIPIPSGYMILVKVGQKITAGETIAKLQESSQDFTIDISKDLEIDPKNSVKFITKKPGDRVEVGDVIAKKGGVLGSREIRTKVSGTILKFDEETGQLVIHTSDSVTEDKSGGDITSPVDGAVEVCDNDKVVLKTEKEAILADEATGANSFGEILFFDHGGIDASHLDDKVEGKILVGKKFDRETISKAIGLGAIGIIGESIDESVLENLRSKNITTPVMSVNEENFKKIGKSGKLMLDAEKKLIVNLS